MDQTASKAQHDYAVYLFQQGFYGDTVAQLDELLRVEETGERWSDWATAQFALEHFAEAERGFRRALEMNPGMADAAVNFGMMLSSQGRCVEAVELFERALPNLEGDARGTVQGFTAQCRAQLGEKSRKRSQPKARSKKRRPKARR
ncbi:MAG TPA: tetratricopeptide repeat protein [Verrucomicrobiae bacterium]|jgi:Tfp pilus assembly protein PilF|nr:tetratricopeptide repeat protein [Verrucomicrobiae bacterium]